MANRKFLTSISELDGVGEKKAEALNGHGIHTFKDLMYYFPRRHLDRTSIIPISKLRKGMTVTTVATVQAFNERSIRRRKIFQVITYDGTGILTLTWFNGIRFLKRLFNIGDKIAIHGKVEWYGGATISHPEFDKLSPDDDPVSTGAIIPLYPLTNELKTVGVDQRVLRKMVRQVFQQNLIFEEIYPQLILKNNNLIPLYSALENIHFADNKFVLQDAIKRLKFDEHFFLQLLMAKRRKYLKNNRSVPLTDVGPYFNKVVELLSFELTDAQKRVIEEVHRDLKKKESMNRLLQGDVGSGKTIVAILISVMAIGNNVQVAVMAPTEILARQHYQSFKKLLDKVKIPIAILLGNMKKVSRNSVLNGLEKGKISIVVGTHALIQEDVVIKRLGLVIIDEQHRFGVNQRLSLIKKGWNPHFLAMTATPIPRTLSITYHGDMDLSIIDEMPKDRIPVTTKIIYPKRLPSVYNFIKDEVKLGHQCMIIYPMVEESKKTDLQAAVDSYDLLKKSIFAGLNIGLVHGKMKSADKDKIMQKFGENKIQILVSTTVVEVGVDIPNATVMLVEHAERFGLTQLHQLRGRVGRGSNRSFCILVCRKENKNAKTRLDIMEKSTDGFLIADEDLKLRGPGEFLGKRQSGFFKFKIANMITDGTIIKQARDAAIKIIDDDPSLEGEEYENMKDVFLTNYAEQINSIFLS
tara:strand:+ start:2942 stop:5023 length:2082 start_codon:yes stop_codon:yes gene_type:complete